MMQLQLISVSTKLTWSDYGKMSDKGCGSKNNSVEQQIRFSSFRARCIATNVPEIFFELKRESPRMKEMYRGLL